MPSSGRVVRGYGILQPRVSVSLAEREPVALRRHLLRPTGRRSVHDRRLGRLPGSLRRRDVHRKGHLRRRRVPASDGRTLPREHSLLSHDLIEGAFARAGLVTDIEVFDDYPTRYLTSTRRTHRWIRGDWQLLRWLTSRVPGARGSNLDPLSKLSRWKIVDNMRRSLTPVVILAWLVAGWTLLPGSWLAWTTAALAALERAVGRSARRSPPCARRAARAGGRTMPRWRATHRAPACSCWLSLVLLPHQALLASDAIVRTFARLLGRRRRLLEWQTASQVERTTRLRPAVRLAAHVAGGPARRRDHGARRVARDRRRASLDARRGSPSWRGRASSVAWLLAPESRSRSARRSRAPSSCSTRDQRATALRYALRHWRFFDRFVTAETHWLIPDNFQETPEPVVAPRTSPTNIGLQLLATMSACDLGFLTRGEMIDRLERAFDSLERMPRLRGHLFNWYDLSDLRVLDPPYVSTVDSGNLAGHLIALAQGCLALADAPVDDDARVWAALDAEGLGDAAPEPVDGARTSPSWIGERLVAYEAAILDLRRRASRGDARPTIAAPALWGRQRLEAAAAALYAFQLDAEDDAAMPLRARRTYVARRRGAGRSARGARASRARHGDGDGLPVPLRPAAPAVRHRLRRAIGHDSTSRPTICSRPRRGWRASSPSRRATPRTEHWFRLGRSLTVADGATALVSWSGSMFEYLMPLLVMPPRPFSLLDQTYHAAVQRQIAYATHARRAVGHLGVGVQRARPARHVSVPRVRRAGPRAQARPGRGSRRRAVRHRARRGRRRARRAAQPRGAGARRARWARIGFCDALDYTRLGPDERVAVVRTFMAHHIGMSLVALDNALSIGDARAGGNLAAALHGRRRRPRHGAAARRARSASLRAAAAAVRHAGRGSRDRGGRRTSMCTRSTRRTRRSRTSRCSAAAATACCSPTPAADTAARTAWTCCAGAPTRRRTTPDSGSTSTISPPARVVRRPPARARDAVVVSRVVRERSRRVHAPRRRGRYPHGDRGRRRRARRDPARDAHQPVARRPRHRADELWRGRAVPRGRGPRASGVSESVRRDRVGAGGDAARQPAAAIRATRRGRGARTSWPRAPSASAR